LTNYLLERLLKLTLIYDEVGIGSKPSDSWGTVFELIKKIELRLKEKKK